MTGYGRAVLTLGNNKAAVELKSVNHRFFEVSMKIPRQLMPIEDKIKKVISDYVQRGRVEAYISVDGEPLSSKFIKIDWNLMDQYVESIQMMKDRYGLNDSISLTELLRLEQAFDLKEEASRNDEKESLILQAVKQAAENLLEMRRKEGSHLSEDFTNRLSELEKQLTAIEEYAPQVLEAYRRRLSQRVAEFTEGNYDEGRILTEAAVFADKADISEEVLRIKSHIAQFRDAMLDEEPVGRKLDFLVQELNREANTIGSKANDSKISSIVVHSKSLIEKLKEQVQNIE